MSTDAMGSAAADAPTTELVTAAVSDRCANCQAPMAADQRYCLNCGARRGRARFAAETFAAPSSTTVVEHTVPPPPPRRASSATTWVAGIATLLIAMGVGVLIGHNSTNSGRVPAAQVITVGGGAGSGATTSPSSTAGSTTAGSTHKGPGKAVKPTVVHVTAKSLKASNAAASKVLGSSNNLSKNVQQQVGGSCSTGAGCQNGKFTGNYFPTG